MGCVNSSTVRFDPIKALKVSPGSFITSSNSGLPSYFQPVSILGKGAFATVKLCIDTRSGHRRAIKFIAKQLLHWQQLDSALFLKEVQILKSLDHPHILRCLAVHEDSDYFYVVTEYCPEGSLYAKLQTRQKFTEAECATIMQQLLSAVAYCHSLNVIHRDLKPENIFLEASNDTLSIKVGDFGSGYIRTQGETITGCFGSGYYIAPEVFYGSYNEKCDEWSCGVIMYVLLTGRPPYPGTCKEEVLELAKKQPLQVARLSGRSWAATMLMRNLLTINAEERVTALQAVAHPWILGSFSAVSDLKQSLACLSEFKCTQKLRDVVALFFVTHLLLPEESSSFKQRFKTLDKNGDGKLTREELLEEFCKTMDRRSALSLVRQVISQVDSDHNGVITYSEFLKTCVDQTRLVAPEVLQRAFSLFDKDKNGWITPEELKATLGSTGTTDDALWEVLLQEADANGDGVIDPTEFREFLEAPNADREDARDEQK